MKDEAKTKEQLISELTELRQRVAELNKLETERKRAEEALQEAGERHRAISEQAADSIVLVDATTGELVEFNDRAYENLGYTREEFERLTIPDFEVVESVEEVAKHIEKIIKEEPAVFETQHRTKGGEIRDVQVSSRAICIGGRNFVQSVWRDITERKQAEQALRESEAGLAKAQQIAHLGNFDWNVKDNTSYLSDEYYRIFGLSPREVGFTYEDFISYVHPDDREFVKRATEESFYQNAPHSIDYRIILPDGSERTVHSDAEVTFDEAGEPIWMVGIIQDITEREKAEEALRESEQNFRHSLDNSPLGIRIINAGGETIYANRAILDIYSYSSIEEFKSIPAAERHTLKSYAERQERVRKREAGEPVPDRFEQSIIHKNGEVRDLEVFNREVLWGGEKQFQLIYHDITERKRSEEEVRGLAKFPSQNPNPVLRVAKDGTILYANQAGLPLLNIWGCQVGQIIPEYWHKFVLDALSSGSSKDTEIKCGGRVLFLTFAPVAEMGYVNLYGLDITERKRAEEALRESEERFRIASQIASDVVYERDLQTGIATFYGDIDSHLGYEPGGYPRTMEGWREHIHPEDLAWFDTQSMDQLEPGVPYSIEYRMRKKDGTYMTWLDRIMMIWDEKAGRPLKFIGAATDITEHKRAEEREKQLQKEFNLASRLASVGKLAAGVAHEINNPLTGVLAFSERLLRKSTDEKVSRDLKRINDEARRAARVVERLLTFARYREPEKEYLNINSVVRKALGLRAFELKTGNIKVELDLAVGLPRVMVDSHQFQEVFLSIIMNAEQAITEADRGEKLGIKTQPMKDCIRISFTDDGPGIPAEQLDKIFDPFFTSRGKEGGTGLGLSVCYGIVQRHDGRIYAKSKPGKGATFTVELPLTGENVKEAKKS